MKTGISTAPGPQHVAEEARHLHAPLPRDGVDHEVRRIADVGVRAHEHRTARDRGQRQRALGHQLPGRRRRPVRRTRGRSGRCRGRTTARRSARNSHVVGAAVRVGHQRHQRREDAVSPARSMASTGIIVMKMPANSLATSTIGPHENPFASRMPAWSAPATRSRPPPRSMSRTMFCSSTSTCRS